MATWIFEPGHTEARVKAGQMVTGSARSVQGHPRGPWSTEWDRVVSSDVRGRDRRLAGSGTGETAAGRASAQRPTSSTSRNHPEIRFAGRVTERTGATTSTGTSGYDRGRPARSRSTCRPAGASGNTPFWVGDERRRHGADRIRGQGDDQPQTTSESPWEDELPGGGVSRNDIDLRSKTRPIARGLERTGAILVYRGGRDIHAGSIHIGRGTPTRAEVPMQFARSKRTADSAFEDSGGEARPRDTLDTAPHGS